MFPSVNAPANANNISLDKFRELFEKKTPLTKCTVSSLEDGAGHPNCFKINLPESDVRIAVSMSIDRAPEVFLPQVGVGDVTHCCYSSNALEKLFQVKTQPWHFLRQNINYSKLKVLDDFLSPNSPVYTELSSSILESAESSNSIWNVSPVIDNGTLSVGFDFRTDRATLKCTLQVNHNGSTQVYINDVVPYSHTMRLNYKRFIEQASSFPFSPLSDRLSLRMSDYAADLERKVASFEQAWAQVCALVDQLCSTMSALRADYSAFGMPVHLTFLSGQRRVFLSIAVTLCGSRAVDPFRIELKLRAFGAELTKSRIFRLDQSVEMFAYLKKELHNPAKSR